MSLKTDYFDGVTGLLTQCDNAFAAGQTLVSANLTTISNALKDNAAAGFTTFTVNLPASLGSALLRGNKANNLITKSYLAGIQDGLASQAIYNFEVTPALNVTDTIATTIDLKFTFQTM